MLYLDEQKEGRRRHITYISKALYLDAPHTMCRQEMREGEETYMVMTQQNMMTEKRRRAKMKEEKRKKKEDESRGVPLVYRWCTIDVPLVIPF